ncbi:peptide chain release factor H [Delftia tsuruhatensis]|uniref:Peptide chain release factor H n=1 Tax=Delftia tsuruhatensis TaxID=180282 RepID=A0ABM6E443_9BURK|nr:MULTISPECIES: peptide chain release factor H [Delftia]AOV02011.1 peptide chain release factor H [Delftia tsuruhatensis]KEH11530.1 peptide chain release factor H [Delftia sp. 670]MDH2230027.1 peptide chain release factor H [Delftia tsuruhatensis]BDE72981.1 peptide chain release factor-like protein [Delftia lacustris]
MLLIQLTASHGPAECEHAVRLTLRELLRDCAASGIAVDVLEETPTPAGYRSVLLRCEGDTGLLHGTLGAWLGTIQWVFDSPLRPHHPRRNWFVAVQQCEPPRQLPADGEIVFQACKASGKGGQHVNTTDSAVHALHVPSGISVKVMSERSQHANKRLARELLALKLARLNAQGEGQARRTRSQLHWEVERGSPVKVFRA